MDLNQYVSLIGNFGFPLVLATYLLLRMERKIESLTDAINELHNYIESERKSK
ncbi:MULTISPECIES: YvrJ family protein [Bacillus]|uniref:YvrJ family protein n=2 Tax=Bacillus cereus group TaxID=86661 RepID=A0A2C1DQC7_BACCE|nr:MULTISPECIES: YvrJ family protein [Bacillus cereus group]OFD69947.1 hypothetical protein BWGOE8_58680 [Bacillus mycoides]OFD69958.1 hypothetical protein BWGOE9_57920 [Bacillus mycoides]OFD70584.1 hypothetical protein BWGOE10_57730 [Bacillus mycoides]PGT02592.1 YvrJ family protein [Bacillus cereus]